MICGQKQCNHPNFLICFYSLFINGMRPINFCNFFFLKQDVLSICQRVTQQETNIFSQCHQQVIINYQGLYILKLFYSNLITRYCVGEDLILYNKVIFIIVVVCSILSLNTFINTSFFKVYNTKVKILDI